jgi:GNAT superfamily N-acetyltransferase
VRQGISGYYRSAGCREISGISGRCSQKDGVTYVITYSENNKVLGRIKAAFHLKNPVIFIERIGVIQEARGRNISTLLFERLIDMAGKFTKVSNEPRRVAAYLAEASSRERDGSATGQGDCSSPERGILVLTFLHSSVFSTVNGHFQRNIFFY